MIPRLGYRAGRSMAIVGLLAAAAGVLVGCAGQTVVASGSASTKYDVAVRVDPMTIKAPQAGTINYGIVDPAKNKPVTQFEEVGGALLHSVIISSDLTNFYHGYSQQVVDSSIAAPAYFPVYGKYNIYAQFKPLGDAEQLYRGTITAGTSDLPEPNLVPDTSYHKATGWLTFDMFTSPNPVKKGVQTQIVFHISEFGKPVTTLWPFFGSAGQLWIVDEKGESFARVDGTGTSTSNSQAAPPATTTAVATVTTGPANQPSANTTTGGSGAGGAGSGASRAGLSGTPAAGPSPTPPPVATVAPDIANSLTAVATTPTVAIPPAQQTAQGWLEGTPAVVPSVEYGPDIVFSHVFPHAGNYKMWLEVLYRGQIAQASYVVKVGE